MVARVSAWSGPSLTFLKRQGFLVERHGEVELAGVLVAYAEQAACSGGCRGGRDQGGT